MVTTHNPKSLFNVDLCGGLPAVIIKMLVDSRPGNLELLPVLPRQWPTGRIEGIRCRSQIVLKSLAWNERVITVALQSAIPQKVVLRTASGIRALEIKSGNGAIDKAALPDGGRTVPLPTGEVTIEILRAPPDSLKSFRKDAFAQETGSVSNRARTLLLNCCRSKHHPRKYK